MFGEQRDVIVIGADDAADQLQGARMGEAVDAGIEGGRGGQGEAGRRIGPVMDAHAVAGTDAGTDGFAQGVGGRGGGGRSQRAELKHRRAGKRRQLPG